jgi:hypothetical protein
MRSRQLCRSTTLAVAVLALSACSTRDASVPATGDSTAADSSQAPVPAALTPAATAQRDGIGACTAPSGADTVCYHASRSVDFAADGHPFTVTVDGRGPRADSMQVRLRITRGDTVYHRADWTTALYGRYDARPVAADSSRRRAEAQLARVLADDALRPTANFLGGASDRDRMLRETIGFDVAVAAERRRLGLTPADSLPLAAANSPPPVDDTTRVRTLATELRSALALRYFTGGEATYAVAWSPTEGRFVTVYACC